MSNSNGLFSARIAKHHVTENIRAVSRYKNFIAFNVRLESPTRKEAKVLFVFLIDFQYGIKLPWEFIYR